MDKKELAAIQARAEAATAEPWHVFKKWRIEVWDKDDNQIADLGYIGEVDEHEEEVMAADAAFIAHAREDVPQLLAEVERLQAALAAQGKLVTLIAAEAWYGHDAPYYAEIRRIMEAHKRDWHTMPKTDANKG